MNQMNVLDTLLQLFKSYGYWIVFFGVMLENAGLPVPGETILLAAGFVASEGDFSVPMVMLIATAGAVLGDNCGYWIGRRVGRGVLVKYGRFVLLTETRFRSMETYFAAHGDKDGHPYSVPLNIHRANVLWYSNTVLSGAGLTTAPATWADFETDAAALKAKGITPLAIGDSGIWANGMIFETILIGTSFAVCTFMIPRRRSDSSGCRLWRCSVSSTTISSPKKTRRRGTRRSRQPATRTTRCASCREPIT